MPTITHELASTSLPNPLQLLRCLRSHTALKICLCSSAPISALTHPHASTQVPLNMLMLPLHPQNLLPTLEPHLCAPSLCLHTPASYHPHASVLDL
ncbi:hypothetical protein O181_029304 [Austropuccinia psidii MF-1]|uniref:Uncharacterized protein n=1 Tax=Austropuccinia psidii MF-1 TaxID=1389203 RepID=A0A9Q3CS46_9BASI|nr:hypothetical protein [Austropuccinia psidii MF-1]